MDEIMDSGFAEFEAAFEGADGNQTDTMEAAEETTESTTEAEETEETGTVQDDTEEPESDETSEGENTSEAEKDGAEVQQEDTSTNVEQKFVVKVNGEMREVEYQDAPAWIQKGMDYDRVKGQLETERGTTKELQEKVDKFAPHLEVLEMASEKTGLSIDQILENVHINILKGQGLSDSEARAQIRADRLEKQIQSLSKAQQKPAQKQEQDDGSERAQREIEEFIRNFPGVKLSDQQLNAMRPDVNKGMSMTAAYLKMENNRLKAEAEARKEQEAATAQNKKNRTKAQPSQNDSGGQRTKSAEDEFFAAFGI